MKTYILPVICLLIFSGCKKNPLDITPDGRITLSDVFSDNNKTGDYLNSCYNYIQPQGIAYDWWSFLDGFTDNAHNNDDPTENLNATDWYKGGLSPTHNPLDQVNPGSFNTNYYGKAWDGIRVTNVFLANIDQAKVDDPHNRSRWKAEAEVLRAYYYWWLIRMYGGMPIIDKPIPLTFNFTQLTRSSFDSCVQFIIANCDSAIANPDLPWRITNESERGRMTKAVAYAIESEASLFNASTLWNPSNDISKWQKAAAISKKALSELLSHGYALYPDYARYFLITPDISSDPADKETIFQIKNSSNINWVQNLNGIPFIHAYKAGCTPSQELVDAYEMSNGIPPILGYKDADHLQPIINPLSGYDENHPYQNRDPRFYATVLYNGAHYGVINGVDHYIESYVNGSDGISNNQREHTHNGYYLRKYVDTTLTPSQHSSASWREFRLAEIYLNLAEAENEAYGPDQVAYDAVNAVRERVGMPPLPMGLTQGEFRQRVRNERRVEFAFDGNRFWDVRRWKIIDSTDRLTTGMEWVKNSDGTFSHQRIVVDRRLTYFDRFLIFPIPQSEISNLPGFQQNPGW